jgi:hypothetical protein
MMATLDAAARDYLAAVRQLVAGELGDLLVGCYAYGSACTREFVPGRSDLDLITLTRTWMPEATQQVLVELLRALPRPPTLKGLDIWFLPLATSMSPGISPGYQVRMLTALDFVHRDDRPRHGDPRLAMLLAICRNHSVAVVGPHPARVIGRVPLAGILGGMLADLSSHAPPHYRVLNACRDLHFLHTGRMCSKLQGIAWARGRLGSPGLLDAAAAWQRHGTGPELDEAQVEALVSHVADRLRDGVQLGDLPPACRRWLERDPAPDVGPKVTCVMPTYNRRGFVERSIRLFLTQDYPNAELVVVDDGEDDVSDLVPPHTPVRHVRLRRRTTIGEKRNLVAEETDGDLLVQWDDDDWYGPARLSRQVGPLVSGRADVTAIQKSWLADLDDGRFFRRRLLPRRVTDALAWGTLALTTDIWRHAHRYPHASRLEDRTMYLRATDLGARVESVANDGIYVYTQHGANSWRFLRGPADHTWWAESPRPAFVSAVDGERYFRLPGAAPSLRAVSLGA